METEQYEEAVRDYKKLTEVDASNRGNFLKIEAIFVYTN